MNPVSGWRSSNIYASLAFAAISCGVYGYPIDAAVEIAIERRLPG